MVPSVHPIFNYFDRIYRVCPAARAALNELLGKERYTKNELIQQTGNSCRTVYFVSSGIARIFFYKDGEDITEHFAFAGDVIVRAESLFTGEPTPKGIQALQEVELLAIDAVKLFALYDTHHDVERLFRLIFEQEYVAAIKRVESLQLQHATERYLDLVQTTDLINQIPLRYIASYLGITQVSLSRIRAGLR
ncbi:Crp/Fnr family transcriptional regulator [Phaeodactylibacter xiamenensis]|uniref:Crp/Fnr family transcriptional regulator n=1 Tax=Phaeodactylibacter xiamenensis TaxID=1524460 RepID=UPI0024A92DC4|nr:Crp/Fnr family transcriptional regulator [Phaeodactylibacter xiamenensis]